MRRAVIGFALAVVIGVGPRPRSWPASEVLRTAVGSLITGLQTMPSIAWFPLAILLFELKRERHPLRGRARRRAVDRQRAHRRRRPVPPLLLRAGGCSAPAGSVDLYRHVILPAALPAFVAGLKQGWAFAWRSLMAGELLVDHRQPAVDRRASLQFARELSDAPRACWR